jgi:hypothetical protein
LGSKQSAVPARRTRNVSCEALDAAVGRRTATTLRMSELELFESAREHPTWESQGSRTQSGGTATEDGVGRAGSPRLAELGHHAAVLSALRQLAGEQIEESERKMLSKSAREIHAELSGIVGAEASGSPHAAVGSYGSQGAPGSPSKADLSLGSKLPPSRQSFESSGAKLAAAIYSLRASIVASQNSTPSLSSPREDGSGAGGAVLRAGWMERRIVNSKPSPVKRGSSFSKVAAALPRLSSGKDKWRDCYWRVLADPEPEIEDSPGALGRADSIRTQGRWGVLQCFNAESCEGLHQPELHTLLPLPAVRGDGLRLVLPVGDSEYELKCHSEADAAAWLAVLSADQLPRTPRAARDVRATSPAQPAAQRALVAGALAAAEEAAAAVQGARAEADASQERQERVAVLLAARLAGTGSSAPGGQDRGARATQPWAAQPQGVTGAEAPPGAAGRGAAEIATAHLRVGAQAAGAKSHSNLVVESAGSVSHSNLVVESALRSALSGAAAEVGSVAALMAREVDSLEQQLAGARASGLEAALRDATARAESLAARSGALQGDRDRAVRQPEELRAQLRALHAHEAQPAGGDASPGASGGGGASRHRAALGPWSHSPRPWDAQSGGSPDAPAADAAGDAGAAAGSDVRRSVATAGPGEAGALPGWGALSLDLSGETLLLSCAQRVSPCDFLLPRGAAQHAAEPNGAGAAPPAPAGRRSPNSAPELPLPVTPPPAPAPRSPPAATAAARPEAAASKVASGLAGAAVAAPSPPPPLGRPRAPSPPPPLGRPRAPAAPAAPAGYDADAASPAPPPWLSPGGARRGRGQQRGIPTVRHSTPPRAARGGAAARAASREPSGRAAGAGMPGSAARVAGRESEGPAAGASGLHAQRPHTFEASGGDGAPHDAATRGVAVDEGRGCAGGGAAGGALARGAVARGSAAEGAEAAGGGGGGGAGARQGRPGGAFGGEFLARSLFLLDGPARGRAPAPAPEPYLGSVRHSPALSLADLGGDGPGRGRLVGDSAPPRVPSTSTDSGLGAAIGKVATAVAAPRRLAARRSILEELWGEVQGASKHRA